MRADRLTWGMTGENGDALLGIWRRPNFLPSVVVLANSSFAVSTLPGVAAALFLLRCRPLHAASCNVSHACSSGDRSWRDSTYPSLVGLDGLGFLRLACELNCSTNSALRLACPSHRAIFLGLRCCSSGTFMESAAMLTLFTSIPFRSANCFIALTISLSSSAANSSNCLGLG